VDSLGSDNHISIENSSKHKANVGIGMDKVLTAVVPNVPGNVTEDFNIHPTYYVSAYQDLKIGQIVDSVGRIGEPIKLDFPNYKSATVTLEQDGDSLKLSVKYG
jgi:hypothetical protein